MFKNYITTALRNMARNRLYSLINVGGLALGLAACILILLFVSSGLIVAILALLTVGWQALKAARGKPIHALRYE